MNQELSEGAIVGANVVCVQAAETVDESRGWFCGAQEERVGEGATILFVEDEVFVRDVTAEVLQSAGYRVLTAKNAVEARCAYEQNRGEVDLLLTDVVLPGETGRVLADRLRRETPELKVLFVTGYAEQMGVREGERDSCLAKPFSTGVLLRTVRQLICDVDTAKEIAV